MKTKTTLAALILAALPGLASAMCSGYGHEETATISCGEGTTFDAAAGKCVTNASS